MRWKTIFDTGHRVALEIGSLEIRYGDLEAQVNRLARVFQARELARGDHIAVVLSDGSFALVAAWAAWRSGVYLTPVSTSLSVIEAAHVIRDSESRLVIVN
jgi:long-chain acyl-CoA synthetase